MVSVLNFRVSFLFVCFVTLFCRFAVQLPRERDQEISLSLMNVRYTTYKFEDAEGLKKKGRRLRKRAIIRFRIRDM